VAVRAVSRERYSATNESLQTSGKFAWKLIFAKLRRLCYEPPEDQQITW
jgi:hypothetical protein